MKMTKACDQVYKKRAKRQNKNFQKYIIVQKLVNYTLKRPTKHIDYHTYFKQKTLVAKKIHQI